MSDMPEAEGEVRKGAAHLLQLQTIRPYMRETLKISMEGSDDVNTNINVGNYV